MVFLVLVILGVMREVVLLRGEVVSLANLVTRAPQPSYLGQQLPAPLIQALEANNAVPDGGALLFLSSDCSGCLALLEEVWNKLGQLPQLTCVVKAKTAADHVAAQAKRVAGSVVIDINGELLRVAEVVSTPSGVAFRPGSYETYEFSAGGDEEWLQRIFETAPQVGVSST